MKRYRLELKYLDIRSYVESKVKTMEDTELVDFILELTEIGNSCKIVFVDAKNLLEACQKIDRETYRIESCMELG